MRPNKIIDQNFGWFFYTVLFWKLVGTTRSSRHLARRICLNDFIRPHRNWCNFYSKWQLWQKCQIFERLYFLISILVVNIVTVFVTFRPIMDLIQKFPNHTQIIITLSLGKLTYYTGTKILKFARPLLIFWEALRF